MNDEIRALQKALTEAIEKERRDRGPAFSVGDKIAWSHETATMFAQGAVLTKDAVVALSRDPEAETPRFGEVIAIMNEEGTAFEVRLDDIGKDEKAHGFDGPSVRTLTADELVKVA